VEALIFSFKKFQTRKRKHPKITFKKGKKTDIRPARGLLIFSVSTHFIFYSCFGRTVFKVIRPSGVVVRRIGGGGAENAKTKDDSPSCEQKPLDEQGSVTSALSLGHFPRSKAKRKLKLLVLRVEK